MWILQTRIHSTQSTAQSSFIARHREWWKENEKYIFMINILCLPLNDDRNDNESHRICKCIHSNFDFVTIVLWVFNLLFASEANKIIIKSHGRLAEWHKAGNRNVTRDRIFRNLLVCNWNRPVHYWSHHCIRWIHVSFDHMAAANSNYCYYCYWNYRLHWPREQCCPSARRIERQLHK